MRRVPLWFCVALCLALLCGARCSLLPGSGAERIVIVQYNAHNLCDDVDTGREYPEFRMDGGRWSKALYRKRLSLLYEAVSSLVEDKALGPDILCLQEIESEKVLADLAAGPFRRAGYRVALLGGPEDSLVRCGVLSRFPLVTSRCHSVNKAGGFVTGRDIIEASFDCGPGCALTLFVCHWKSRKEGAAATEGARRETAGLVAARIREIVRADPLAAIVVCGDFNESPDEFSRVNKKYPTAFMPSAMLQAAGATNATDSAAGAGATNAATAGAIGSFGAAAKAIYVAASQADAGAVGEIPVLYSPWFGVEGYSYQFDGNPERLDGFLLSAGLCDGAGIDFQSFSVADAPFLFDKNDAIFSWTGTAGYSDHLPVVLRLSVSPSSR